MIYSHIGYVWIIKNKPVLYIVLYARQEEMWKKINKHESRNVYKHVLNLCYANDDVSSGNDVCLGRFSHVFHNVMN